MWCSTFAFQPWHGAVEFKRYLVRFAHMVEGFNRLKGIMRTVYNQYNSLVRPLLKWLQERGVVFEMNTRVTDLGLIEDGGRTTVTRISHERDGVPGEIVVAPGDVVLVTLGSMTEASSLGGMNTAPVLHDKSCGGAWSLWERIATGRPAFGNPAVFADHIERVEVGVVHHHAARSGVASDRQRLHRQCAGRGWPDYVSGFGLACFDRHPLPAALH